MLAVRHVHTVQFVRVGVREYHDVASTCGCVLCVVLRLDEYFTRKKGMAHIAKQDVHIAQNLC